MPEHVTRRAAARERPKGGENKNDADNHPVKLSQMHGAAHVVAGTHRLSRVVDDFIGENTYPPKRRPKVPAKHKAAKRAKGLGARRGPGKADGPVRQAPARVGAVHKVTDAPADNAKGRGGHHHVEIRPHVDSMDARVNPHRQHDAQHAAVKRDATLPDIKSRERVAAGTEECARRGEHVDQARADDAREHQVHEHVEQLFGVQTALFGEFGGVIGANQHAKGDKKTVPAERQRSKLEHDGVHTFLSSSLSSGSSLRAYHRTHPEPPRFNKV